MIFKLSDLAYARMMRQKLGRVSYRRVGLLNRAARLLILNKRKQNLNIIPRNAKALRATARSKLFKK